MDGAARAATHVIYLGLHRFGGDGHRGVIFARQIFGLLGAGPR